MKRAALVLALMAMPFAASHAGDLSYSWVEADYLHVDPDHFDGSNGVAVRGSGALGDNFNVIAGWTKVDGEKINVGGANVRLDDQKAWYAGFGYHTPISSTVDLFAEVAYNKETSFDANGYSGRVGVRASFTPQFEAGASIGRSKIDHFEGNTAVDVYGQYKFTPTVGVVAEATIGNNDKSFLVGPRVSF
jgi:outer membrane autotransporter protein